MHGDDDDIVLDGLDDAALHIVGTANLLQTTKQQRMVAHNEISPLTDGFVNDGFVDVQTQ